MTGILVRDPVTGGSSRKVYKINQPRFELGHHVEADNQSQPRYPYDGATVDDGPAVQVLFGDARGAGVLGQTATEHVGQTAALALVHKDEQGQHEAEQHDDDVSDTAPPPKSGK